MSLVHGSDLALGCEVAMFCTHFCDSTMKLEEINSCLEAAVNR